MREIDNAAQVSSNHNGVGAWGQIGFSCVSLIGLFEKTRTLSSDFHSSGTKGES